MQKYLNNYYVLNCSTEIEILNVLNKRMDVFYNNPKNIVLSEVLSNSDHLIKNIELTEMCNISKISSGKTPISRSQGKSSEYTIPLLRTSNIKKGEIYIDEVTTTFISEKDLSDSNIVLENDILITIVGATLKIVGRAAIYNLEEYHSSINQNIARIRCTNESVIPKYLMIYLNSTFAQKQIERISKQGNQVNLNAKEVGEIKVIVPDLEIQKSIIAQYEKLFNQLQNSKDIIDTGLEKISNLLCNYTGLIEPILNEKNSVFINEISSIRLDYNFYNPTYNSYIDYILSKNDEYPIMTIKELAYGVFRGDTPSQYYSSGIKVLQINNIDPFKLTYEDAKFISEEEYKRKPRFQLRENDLLISGVGPPLGEVCIVKRDDLPLAAYNHISVIRLNENLIDPLYLCAFLNSSFGQMQMKKYYTGVRQIYLTNEWIEKLLILVPPFELQKIIADEVSKVLSSICNAEKNFSEIESTIFDDILYEYLKIDKELH